eukprot:4252420-Alexandrium_andersonii.AAC.1
MEGPGARRSRRRACLGPAELELAAEGRSKKSWDLLKSPAQLPCGGLGSNSRGSAERFRTHRRRTRA